MSITVFPHTNLYKFTPLQHNTTIGCSAQVMFRVTQLGVYVIVDVGGKYVTVHALCNRACSLVRFSIPNLSQHVATTGWPNAHNMLHPTMLRYVAFNCSDRLAGACRCWANNVRICYLEMLRSFRCWGLRGRGRVACYLD